MNQDEALAFLNPSQGNQLGTPAQPESMSPDEKGQQLTPQSRATGMSQEDALAFLGIGQQQKAPIPDSAYLNAPPPEPDLPPSDPNNLTSNYTQSVPQATPQNANQKPQGMSKEDALAFLGSTPSATPEQAGKVINLPAIPQASPSSPKPSQLTAALSGAAEGTIGLLSGLGAAGLALPVAGAVGLPTSGIGAVPVELGAFFAGSKVGELGAKEIEKRLGLEEQIKASQQEYPKTSSISGLLPMLPMAIESGLGYATTGLTKGLGALATKAGIGAGVGAGVFEPTRYGVDVAAQKIGLTDQPAEPITPKSLAEQAAFGLALGGMEGGKKPSIIPETKLNPSANPVVNQREEQINAMADAQAPIPEAPNPVEVAPSVETPAAEVPAKPELSNEEKLNQLFNEQWIHDEGSPEHTAIQQQIDQLKAGEAPAPAEVNTEEPPAEAPAEAQPTTENAVQEPSAREVGIRNTPAVGEGVGEENKPEVSATEGQAQKEEVKPQEVQLTDEQQAEKVLLDKIDAEAGKPKAPKPKAPEVNPYKEILRRYESGEEDSINNPRDLVDEISKVARKQRNQYLKDAIERFHKAMDVGADVEPEIEKLLNEVKREGDRHEAPVEKKEPKIKTAKDKEMDVFGEGANGLRFVLDNKILDPAQYKRMVNAGIIEGGGEYDFFYNSKLPKKVRDLIFKRDGSPIDEVADAMGKTPHDLLAQIQEAYISAEKAKEDAKAIEQQQKALEEQARQMERLKKTNPQAYDRIAEEEARKFLNGKLRGEGEFVEFPDFIKDAAIKVGDAVRKGVNSFKDWSEGMIARLGEGVRGFLKDIWASVRDNWNKDIGGGSDTGGRSLERAAEEAKYAPKPPTEQEAFAKKVYDTSVSQRGKPPSQEEMSNILARKFPGITSREVSDLYATATGKPKPPAPYTGVASQPSGETISIRSDDQKDQIKRGILTSVVPAGEGTSRSEILEQGNTNLKNGANPFDALEKAKKGDFDALTTAKAYSQALAKKVSDALKKFGPNSPEYKELAKQYQDYYEGIREAGTVASDILRTFQGQTDLSDAADIARQYTQITGDEPSLSKHEQIRKVADEVKASIEQSDKAIEDHKSTMDEGLSNVEVKTPESVEEGRQQIADLSDASGKKNKAEIDRLNAELEQTKKTLEEVKQARETGQDAEALKAYYEAKIKDLEAQKSPKFGKEVLEQAQKLVDKWRADRLEAEKLLTKQLAQMGSFPDVSIVSTLARIMRGHISELGLDFAKSSKLILDKFGPKVEKYLKEAWDKAHSLIKGEDGGEKAVKSVRKVKAKPESKMSPEEKKSANLQKRIDQYQKKIDDINSGKVSTPKEVENVTNEEIRGLEADLAKKKQELSDARLKAKQADLFEKGKLGEKLNPEQVKTLWESAKRFYLDKGESDYDKMINDLANDFGITTEQVREAFSSPKGAKKTSDQLYLKQRNRQLALNKANRWLENQKANFIGKVFGAAAERTFKLAIFGHGTAFIGTHAPTTIYTHPKAAFRAWLKGLSYTFRGKDGRIKNAIDNKDLIYRPNWVRAKRAGLENDPFQNEHEGPSKATSDSILGRSLDALTGGRGFDALYHLRQDMFDQAWDKLSITQKTPEMARIIADSINNATGFTKGGKNTAGILQSPITKVLFFAPKLIASRFNWLIGDPARMIGTFGNMANPFAKVTPEERMSAFSEAKNKLAFLGTLAGTLLANQALLSVTGSNQSINFTDPKKNDWLAYKGFGYNFATVGAMTRIARLLAQEYNAVFGDLTRIQKARGGREAAMKDALYTYFRSGFSPIVRDIVVGATGKDYIGNVAPWSSEQPDRGRKRLTWGEIVQEQFAPIPISEAATQKEIGPAIAKAGTAAFLGARLETPADIEEYQKSLQSKPRRSSGGSSGSKKLFH